MNKAPFSERHPYWFVAALELAVVLVYLSAGTTAHLLKLSSLGLYAIANVVLCVVIAALLTAKGWWRAIGFSAPERRSDLLWFVVAFLPVLINSVSGLELSAPTHVLAILGISLLVGFAEEAIFRGLMLRALVPKGAWKAAIITSVLFAVTHALNVLTGKSVAEDAAQVFYALAIGFAYAALVIRKRVIWPLVAAHFATNFTGFLQQPGLEASTSGTVALVTGVGVVFTAYGLWVMCSPVAERSKFAAAT